MQRAENLWSDGPKRDRLVCALLALVTLLLYLPARHFEFNNFDDAQYLTTNPHVQGGVTWSCVKWAFTTGYAANWHPLTWLSHALDYTIYGAHAGGHHLTGVLFHVANTVLLFLLLRRLTGAFWRSVVVAALFAWHPMHVESVAWVAERKDVLSTFFGLLALMAYVRHARKFADPTCNWRGSYAVAMLFFALGLMSKPMLVSLPLVLLLLDYWPLKRRAAPLALVREKIPFFILSAASCAVTFLVQAQGRAVQSLQILPLRERLDNAVVAYVLYLEKLVYPANLAVIYPYQRALPVWEIAGSIILLAWISWFAWRLRRSHPWWFVGWAWFVVTLVPVIGIVQVGSQAMADRYSYLPSIGLFLALTWELGQVNRPRMRLAFGCFSALVLAAYIIVSSIQIGYWRNSETLFAHAIAVTHNNSLAECNLSSALMDEGRKDEALGHLKEALRINPHYVEALNNMGIFLANAGKPGEAADYFKAALKEMPNFASAHFQLGMLQYQSGKLDDAVSSFRSAVQFNPMLDKAHANLGIILASQGHFDEAVAEFQQALAIQPQNPYANDGLGRILESRGKFAEAAAHYFTAVEAKPDLADAQDNLGAMLAMQRKFAEATDRFKTALKLQPNFPEAHFNLGNALAAEGRAADAAAEFSEALRQHPNYLEAHFNLALALLQTGNADEATVHLREALRLKPQLVPAMEKLAWLLATQPNAKLRDGVEALRLANEAVESTKAHDPIALDALAAAQAETGNFSVAVETARKALDAARATGKQKLAGQIENRISLYLAGKPYREP